jgi:hypothetical protein
MIGSFRQPIGIPDDILPDAWRNVANTNDNDEQTCNAENDDQNCQLMDDDNNNDEEDPCTPYNNNYNNNNNSDNYNTHDDLPTSSDEFRFYSCSTRSTRSTRGHLYRGT